MPSIYNVLAMALLFSNTIANAQQGFIVEFTDEKISIQANNANLKEVLQEVESKSGIAVNFIAEVNERVSIDIVEQSIESALSKLLPNLMLIHDTVDGKKRVVEVIAITDDPELTSSGNNLSNLPTGQLMPPIDSSDPQSNPDTPPHENEAPPPQGTDSMPAPGAQNQ